MQSIKLCTRINWKKPIPTARPSLQITIEVPTQHISTRAGFKRIWQILSEWVRTWREPRDRGNIWSLLYILREINHCWYVKWWKNFSLDYSNDIIKFINKAHYIQYIYTLFLLKMGCYTKCKHT